LILYRYVISKLKMSNQDTKLCECGCVVEERSRDTGEWWDYCNDCYEKDQADDEKDPCDTCGGKAEEEDARWCGACRDKDECRCDYCREVVVGCETTTQGEPACLPCVRKHKLQIC